MEARSRRVKKGSLYSLASFIMHLNPFFLLPLGFLFIFHVERGSLGFTYNGFKSRNLTLDGVATITNNGLLMLTNETSNVKGHAFHPDPIPFKQSQDGSVLSFSTTFIFAIVPNGSSSGHGLVFVIAQTKGFPYSVTKPYLGMFNRTSDRSNSNHVVGVEMDTIYDPDVNDIDGNHVGIDINSVDSVNASHAKYYTTTTSYVNISLSSGKPIQVWVEYDGFEKIMNVTIAPINISKPSIPLLTLSRDISSIFINGSMFVGFSSSTGTIVASHYVLGWSFALNGTAPPLNILNLPDLPQPRKGGRENIWLKIGLAIMSALVIVITVTSFWILHTKFVRKKRSSEDSEDLEELEHWESEYGPHRFRYKDLLIATKGFPDEELLGEGGFGKVYKGILPGSNIEVAVKKVARDARQGMGSFVAEIVSLGELSHKNLVQLLGYCRRKDDLLLVYKYIQNGSLDKYLFNSGSQELTLTWEQRFNIIKGIASGILYLHGECRQVVVHRDIKAANVLLDSEMNGLLSDFGLARLHKRGGDPGITNLIGTPGYIAPELKRTKRPTPSTDMFAFGAFLLEVVCGRRPIDPVEPMLVDMVFECWKRGVVLVAVDRRLKGEYVEEEAKMVLELGLLCSNSNPRERPTIKDVVGYLDKVVTMPDLEGVEMGPNGVLFNMMFARSGSITESQLSQGR